ncbi:MAG: CocE/NonD family hydrolase [Clostridia bacterium]|nr:CocE/NonD family hydrolase [Clostridia bacterium]
MAHFREVLYLPFEGDKICTISARPQERGRYPTVVLRSPYETEHENDTDKELADWLVREYGKWLDAGYAVVFQHSRGTGKSTGESFPVIFERETSLREYDWVRRQPFYNGEIYLLGGSYTAYVHYAAAPYGDDVRGACLEASDCELYNWHYLNGFYKANLYGDWQVLQYRKKAGLTKNYTRDSFRILPMTDYTRSVFGERIEDYDEILLHPDRSDPFWNTHFGGAESRDALKSVKFPVLITTGFFDVFASGIFKMWEDMDPETKARSAFIIHAYHHGGNSDEQPYCFSPAATLEERFPDFDLRWMNYVRGLGEPPVEPGKATYYELFSEDGWKTDDLPEPGRSSTFTLGGGERSYVYDPADPTPAARGLSHCFGGTYFLDPPGSREDVLSFYTPPFGEDVHAGGGMDVRLKVRSDCLDTCFYVRVAIEKPEGDFVLRDGITQISNVCPDYVPGDAVELDFPLDLCRFVIRKGERLRVDVSSAAFPQFVPHTNNRGLFSVQTSSRPATNTVLCDESTLTVKYY